MGAWGPGLQANDTAWDAIGEWGFDVHGQPPTEVITAMLKVSCLRNHFKGWIRKSPAAMLGLADYLLDAGVNLAAMRPQLNAALAKEHRDLDSRRSPEERRIALQRFADRLDGKPFDKAAHARENTGLMSKIADLMDESTNT